MTPFVIGAGVLVLIGIFVAAFRIGKYFGNREGQVTERKEKDDTYVREILSRDREIRNLQRKIDGLNALNSQYLMFMFKVPTIIQHLNSTLTLRQIIDSVTLLIQDIIPAPFVALYLYNFSDGTLRRYQSQSGSAECSADDANNLELIERAARDKIVRTRNQIRRAPLRENGDDSTAYEYWMAAPILFRQKVLGVIGIGKPQNISGNESSLLKMIADIAGVALVNQTMLGEAKQQANTDPLTGISNRNYFIEMGHSFVEKAIRDGSQIAIFLFDIDHFKNYNDTNGHDAGDKLLIELTSLVSSITRKHAVFARYGGEEFIVMMLGTSKQDALIYAERVRETISNHPFENRESQPLGCISISGGVAVFPDDADSLSRTIQLADGLLYRAKQEGRNRIIAHKTRYFADQDIAPEEIPSER